jgi:hypothetical protein
MVEPIDGMRPLGKDKLLRDFSLLELRRPIRVVTLFSGDCDIEMHPVFLISLSKHKFSFYFLLKS